MSVAERTREAVDERPFLRDALAAGVVNYAAAADRLSVDAGQDAVATALRRYETELSVQTASASASVRLERGVCRVSEPEETGLLTIGGQSFRTAGGSAAAVTVRGEGVDARTLERALGRLRTADVTVEAAAVADAVILIVPGRESATALRVVESALA